MKTLVLALLLPLTVLLSGCLALQVKTAFDPEADFSTYRTFSFDSQSLPPDSRYLEEPIRAALEDQLAGKGISRTDKESADLLVSFGVEVETTYSNRGVPNKGPFRPSSGGYEPDVYKEGKIVIDFADPAKDSIVWRAWGGSFDAEEDRAKYSIPAVVEKIMMEYPPGSEG